MSPSDIAIIHEHHRNGRLHEAEQGYLTLLKKYPDNVEALHGLAILYLQLQKYAAAEKYLQAAIRLQPNNPNIHLHLAGVYKTQGLLSEAKSILLQLVKTHSDFAPAFNNLGTLYFAEQQWQQAIDNFRIAISKQPDFLEAYYNLALALVKKNELEEAASVYETLMLLTPDHVGAQFQLACLRMQQHRWEDAIQQFSLIEENFPAHFETQTNLATCYLRKGFLNQAKKNYLKALEIHPDDVQIIFNLAVINSQQGYMDAAIQYYQRILHIDPDNFAAHNNLGVAFLAKQHPGFALKHFREALRIQPNNEAIRYTVHMLSQDQRLLASPADYIKSLFDAYADHYESHLLQALDYKVPELLFDAVNKVKKIPHKKWDILDVGCGTGLCGLKFKSAAKTLTGIDLSEKMLALAAEKNIYDRLQKIDITEFLRTQQKAYDLIIAGDVFVYIGELQGLFASIADALRSGGIFVFNAEISETENFNMMQSGRFSHHKKYLDALLNDNGFTMLSYHTAVTRQQNNQPVYGHIYVAER